eukprot:s3972_g5.t1
MLLYYNKSFFWLLLERRGSVFYRWDSLLGGVLIAGFGGLVQYLRDSCASTQPRRPTLEAPFLLKLCDEVQRAAEALLSHASAKPWSALYAERKNPEFSRLSAMLSFDEAALLEKVTIHFPGQLNVLIFDGVYIRYLRMRYALPKFVLIFVIFQPKLASKHGHRLLAMWDARGDFYMQVLFRSRR